MAENKQRLGSQQERDWEDTPSRRNTDINRSQNRNFLDDELQPELEAQNRNYPEELYSSYGSRNPEFYTPQWEDQNRNSYGRQSSYSSGRSRRYENQYGSRNYETPQQGYSSYNPYASEEYRPHNAQRQPYAYSGYEQNQPWSREQYNPQYQQYPHQYSGPYSDSYNAGQWNEGMNRNRGWENPQHGQSSNYSGMGSGQHTSSYEATNWGSRNQPAHSEQGSMLGQHKGKGPKGYHRSDDRIKEDISDRMMSDSQLDASDIEIEVNNCDVTLTGSVDNREAKRRAEDIAETISGVSNVENRLRVNNQNEQRRSSLSSSSSSSASGLSSTQDARNKRTSLTGATS